MFVFGYLWLCVVVFMVFIPLLIGPVKTSVQVGLFDCAPVVRQKKIRCDLESLSVGELKHTAKVLKLDMRSLLEKKEMIHALNNKIEKM